MLGDTIRDQDGERCFELVEAIRRLSVAYQRKADAEAGRDLDGLLAASAHGDQHRHPASATSRISPIWRKTVTNFACGPPTKRATHATTAVSRARSNG